jgi:hypothetical protein
MEDWQMMKEIVAAVRQAIPDASTFSAISRTVPASMCCKTGMRVEYILHQRPERRNDEAVNVTLIGDRCA